MVDMGTKVDMTHDVLINKAATIERRIQRARDEYYADPNTFAANITRQDAAVLNIQRACEAALDMGQVIIRRHALGIPQSSRDVFALLAQGQRIPADLAESRKKMVGYRNIAVHDYQALLLPITVAIITQHLAELEAFSKHILRSLQV